MQFGLSEEQILLQDNVNRFLDDNTPLDRVRTYAEGGEDADIWAGLTELGVPALLIPEEHGGIGLQPLDAAIVAESLGAHIAPTPFVGSAVIAPTALIAAAGDHARLHRRAGPPGPPARLLRPGGRTPRGRRLRLLALRAC